MLHCNQHHVLLLAIIVLASIVIVSFNFDSVNANQEIYTKGKNFDDYYNPVSHTGTEIRLPYERILDYVDANGNAVYVNYKLRNDVDKIYFESANGNSILFDKASCVLQVYQSGYIIPQSTSILDYHYYLKEAVNGTDTWTGTDHNTLACNDIQIIQKEWGIEIYTKRDTTQKNNSTGQTTGGIFETEHIIQPFAISNDAGYINNDDTKDNTHKYMITDIVDASFDKVTVDGITHTTDFTISKDQLTDDSFEFDIDGIKLLYDKKDAKHLEWEYKLQNQKSEFIGDYGNVDNALAKGEKIELDPTFLSSGSIKRYVSTSTSGTTCSTTYSSDDSSTPQIRSSASSASDSCSVASFRFSISGWDTSKKVTGLKLVYNVTTATNATACRWNEINNDPNSAGGQTVLDDIRDGTVFVSSDSQCQSTGLKTVNLGTGGVSDLQSAIDAARIWFAVGGEFDTELTRDATTRLVSFSEAELHIEYQTQTTAHKPTGLTTEGKPKALQINYTGCSWDGSEANTCSDITGVKVWNVTDSNKRYAEIPIPDYEESDLEYPNVSGSINTDNIKSLFHFESIDVNDQVQDSSGQNKNATVGSSFLDVEENTSGGFDSDKISDNLGGGWRRFIGERVDTTNSALYNKNIELLTVWIKKVGTPTGSNLACGVFETTAGTALIHEFGEIDIATLTTSFVAYTFDTASYTLAVNDAIGCFLKAGSTTDTTNYVVLEKSLDDTIYDNSDSSGFQYQNGGRFGDESDLKFSATTGANRIETITDGLIGNGIELETSFLNLTHTAQPIKNTNDFTFVLGLNFTTISASLSDFISFSDGSNEIAFQANTTKIIIKKGSIIIKAESWTPHTLSKQHLAIKRNSNNFEILVNGTELGSDTNSATSFGTPQNNIYIIGANSTGTGNFLNATLDELAIFSDAKSNSYISNVANRVLNTMTLLQTLGNVTSITQNTNCDSCTKYYRITLTNAQGNGTPSDLAYGTTDNVPDAATGLYATPTSSTTIKFNWSNGASNGGDPIDDYGLRCEVNQSGGWLDTVNNSTIQYNYNYTGLSSGDSVTCQVRLGNDVGFSNWSSNMTSATWQVTQGTVTLFTDMVGDVISIIPNVAITQASPSPVTVDQIQFRRNGTVIQTDSASQQIAVGSSFNFTKRYFELPDGSVYLFDVKARVSNSTGTVTLPSNNSTQQREYDPDFIPSLEGSYDVNYTHFRNQAQDEFTLKVNRDPINFQIECRLRQSGTTDYQWYNYTNIGFLKLELETESSKRIYGDCYNDELLFSFVSYTNATTIPDFLAFIETQIGSDFAGVGLFMAFLILIPLGLFGARHSDSGSVIILAFVAIAAGIGLIVVNAVIWGILVFITGISIFLGTRLRA